MRSDLAEEPTYVLTAGLDADSFNWLDGLRRIHFPPERNVLHAHLTMFHRLSASQLDRMVMAPMPAQSIELTFDKVIFMGFGSAIHIVSEELIQLRKNLKAAIGEGLSRQDDQPWSPHVTVQNKVEPVTARSTYQTLDQTFVARGGQATCLEIWEYIGGPWKPVRRLSFG